MSTEGESLITTEEGGEVPDILEEPPEISLPEYKSSCASILAEYFESEDVGEVARSLQELNKVGWTSEFVKQSVVSSMEKHDRERELISILLSSLYGSVIPAYYISEGFKFVLDRIDDLILDTPNADELLGMFLARAVIDEIIAPAFLTKVHVSGKHAQHSLAKAHRLLEGKNVAKRIANIWGAAGKSVNKIKKSMRLLLEEYVSSLDLSEANRCLRELNTPAFHFKFVKLGVSFALEQQEESKRKLVHALLSDFHKSQLITDVQMISGFQCCVDTICDLCKDITPHARKFLLKFTQQAVDEGYLPSSFFAKAETETQAHLDCEKKAEIGAEGTSA